MRGSPLALGLITGILLATGVAWGVFALVGTPAPRPPEPVSARSPEPGPTPEESRDPTPKKADLAGRVSRGGLVAVSIRGGKAVGYFCDGTNEVWMKGTARDNRVKLSGAEDGDFTLTAELRDGRATGRLGPRGDTWRFTASTVRKPSGLYRATADVRGSRIIGGWIVLADGTQVGAVSVDGLAEPAPRLTPGRDVSSYGVALRPEGVDAFFAGVAGG
ncbi:hypothetical protein [Nonomuraea sp. NPDC048826]|uniref:hypothetical protein n=1 Tax=Nonomuraea sp. NPDC048826 TaxID=3364347 RepID=UPI00371E2318